MKTYSIGRDLNCDIVINDSTDVISRRHALLNVTSSGKMTIIDQSSNGTYVNGIRITQNVPVPVTRKDIISLAHVVKLDWNQIPKSELCMKYAIGAVAAIVVIISIVVGLKSHKTDCDNNDNQNTAGIVDSTTIKQKEAARLDSIKKIALQDSTNKALEKVRQDSIKASKKKSQSKKEIKKTKKEEKENKEDKSSKSKKRAIG